MANIQSAKYLGGTITKSASAKTEIENRISETTGVAKALGIFWKKAKCSTAWKINVYNAVVVAKLTYGLEGLQFNESVGKRLDTFQMRGLRHILGIPPTFIDRSNTDADVIRQAEFEINRNRTGPYKRIQRLTDIIKARKCKLLGHVIRAEDTDPMKMVTFKPNSLKLMAPQSKRVGRPRLNWIAETTKTFGKTFGTK